jgi:hypothetical protein
MIHGVQQWSDQRRETQKGFLAQMRLLGDLYLRRSRRQHPYRNLQTLSGGFLNTDCAVSAFGFADNLKGEAVEWVEWIENTNLLGFCTQGIVRVVTWNLSNMGYTLLPKQTRIPIPRPPLPVDRFPSFIVITSPSVIVTTLTRSVNG